MDAEMIDDGDGVDTNAPAAKPDAVGAADEGSDAEEAERASEVEDVTSPVERTLDPDSADAAEAAMADDLEALVSERDQFKDIALRLQADFDNYRRRVAQQQTEAVERGTGKLAEALLPVLDACEAAFLQHPAEIEPLFNLLLAELRKHGLESLNLQDRPFDPAVADAVLHEPGEGDEPIVSEVLRSGYLWKGRVLRPAMVKVRG